jgi:hypothetical protein
MSSLQSEGSLFALDPTTVCLFHHKPSVMLLAA